MCMRLRLRGRWRCSATHSAHLLTQLMGPVPLALVSIKERFAEGNRGVSLGKSQCLMGNQFHDGIYGGRSRNAAPPNPQHEHHLVWVHKKYRRSVDPRKRWLSAARSEVSVIPPDERQPGGEMARKLQLAAYWGDPGVSTGAPDSPWPQQDYRERKSSPHEAAEHILEIILAIVVQYDKEPSPPVMQRPVNVTGGTTLSKASPLRVRPVRPPAKRLIFYFNSELRI